MEEKFQFNPKCSCLEELIKLMPKKHGDLISDGNVLTNYCIFEFIYYLFPTANNPISANEVRRSLGSKLSPVPASKRNVVVVPVPDSGKAAARGYADRFRYRYDNGFTKNVPKRSFIASEVEREDIAEWKYDVNDEVLNGKNVVIVDDSIVRGTTISRLIVKAFEAWAERVFFKSSAPPLLYYCYCGIDMKKKTDFLARTNLPEGIKYEDIDFDKLINDIHEEVFARCKKIISDKYEKGIYKRQQDYEHILSKINKEHINIEYVSLDNLLDVCNSFFFNNKEERWCKACLDGKLHILKGNKKEEFVKDY